MKKESKATADKSKKSEAIDSKKIEKEENAASKVEEDKTLDNDGRVGTMLRETRLKSADTKNAPRKRGIFLRSVVDYLPTLMLAFWNNS